MKGLVDTNIIIYLSKGLLDIDVLFERYEELLISRITHMEVLGFPFDSPEEEALINQLLAHFPILEIDKRVGEETIQIRKSKRIKLPDAIIFATALVHDCEIVTANESDFKGTSENTAIFNPMK